MRALAGWRLPLLIIMLVPAICVIVISATATKRGPGPDVRSRFQVAAPGRGAPKRAGGQRHAMTARSTAGQPLPAGTVYYVDGKHGSDRASGLCLPLTRRCGPFKHIAAAVNAVARDGAWRPGAMVGAHVEVVGYNDYTYQERAIPAGVSFGGSAAAPVVFEAYGFNNKLGQRYVMPIVSGGDEIRGRWVKVRGYSTVYSRSVALTHWDSKDWQLSTREWRLFVKETALALRRPPECAGMRGMRHPCSLRRLDTADPDSYIMDSAPGHSTGTLYVNLRNAPGISATTLITQGRALTDTNPNTYVLVAEYAPTFYFNANGNMHNMNHIIVQGFRNRYSDSGIAFVAGASNNIARYNDSSYNYAMGFEDAARGLTGFSSNNIFEYNSCTGNTLQCIKFDKNSVNGVARYNVADMGGFLQGLAKCDGDNTSASAHGCRIVHNMILNTTHIAPYNKGSDVVAGVMVQNGSYDDEISGNFFANLSAGVQTHEDRPSTTRPITNVRIISNTFLYMTALPGPRGGWSGYALDLEDGGAGNVRAAYNVIMGTVRPAAYRGYPSAGGAINLAPHTTNKWISHTTIYDVPSYIINANQGAHVRLSDSLVINCGYNSDTHAANASFALWRLDAHSAVWVDHTNIYGNVTASRVIAAGAVLIVAANQVQPGGFDPQFLSTIPGQAGFLGVTTTSPAYSGLSSDGLPLGARWQ